MSTADVSPGRDWPVIGALAVLTAVLTVVAGPLGTLAGVVTAVTWYTLGTVYAIATGHVVLATAFSSGITTESFLVVELAFVVFLCSSLVRATSPLRDTAATVVSASLLVGVAWLISQTQPLWIAAGVLLALFALTAYTLHRYELVRLDLVPLDQPTDSTKTDP